METNAVKFLTAYEGNNQGEVKRFSTTASDLLIELGVAISFKTTPKNLADLPMEPDPEGLKITNKENTEHERNTDKS